VSTTNGPRIKTATSVAQGTREAGGYPIIGDELLPMAKTEAEDTVRGV
jgi:hypothetical protein